MRGGIKMTFECQTIGIIAVGLQAISLIGGILIGYLTWGIKTKELK